MAANLLEEFEIHPIGAPLFSFGGHSIVFTNSALFMFLAAGICTLLMVLAMRPQAVIPGRWQMIAEKIYDLVADLVDSTAGEKARPFFPFIFTIFTFILFCNILSMFPWTFAVTSHIIVNLAIAMLLFSVIIITGFVRHGFHFLSIFVPKGAPFWIMPLICVIEIFSFAVRPFSLSIRLFANMLAGHLLLEVFASLCVTLLAAGWLSGLTILPLIINVAITAFEFFVMFLQAYIYTILASVYLRDALEMH